MAELKTIFRQIFRIIFAKELYLSLDLFKTFPFIENFYRKRRFLNTVSIITHVVFLGIVISGLFGPEDSDRNAAIYIAWGLWWPSIVLSWFFVGRLWCCFCPFPTLGRLIQKVMKLVWLRPLPTYLQQHGTFWSVILLGIIFWIEETTNMLYSPRATVYLMLAILFAATVMSILFPRQTWCRYLCPLGRMIGVGATLSITGIRPDFSKCRSCRTFACKRGSETELGCPVHLGAFNIRNNFDCLMCGRCVNLCQNESPRIYLRSPFSELIMNKGRYITCTYFVPVMVGSQISRFMKQGFLYPSQYTQTMAWDMLIYGFVFLSCTLFVQGLIRIGDRLFGLEPDHLFGSYSPMVPIFLPMAFVGELIYRLNYTLSEAPGFIPTIGRQFGWDLASWSFPMPEILISGIDICLLIGGAMAGEYVLDRLAEEDFGDSMSIKQYKHVQWFIRLLMASYLTMLAFSHHTFIVL